MRIKVSNFTIKYNLRAAHIGLETTAAAAARGTRMQTNKLSRPKHILTSDSDLTTSTAVTLRTRVVTSQLTLLTEPGHCSLSLSPDVVEAVVVVVGVRLRSPGRAASN